MGHYLSEMEGEPFQKTHEIVGGRQRAKKILRNKKLPFRKLIKITHCWITLEPHREWFEISYETPDRVNCFITVSKEQWNKRSGM